MFTSYISNHGWTMVWNPTFKDIKLGLAKGN